VHQLCCCGPRLFSATSERHLHDNQLATDAILEAKCLDGQHFFDLAHRTGTTYKVDLRGPNDGHLGSVRILLKRAINLKTLTFEVDCK